MCDFVAKHKRMLQIVLGLLVIPFAFFGLESYTRSGGSAQDVATVDGLSITQREFGEELRGQQDRLRQMLGAGADLSMLDTPDVRTAILESLISQRLIVLEVSRARLALAKEDVIAGILAAPEFQEGGKFSSERYAAHLRLRSISDEDNVGRLQIQMPAASSLDALLPRDREPTIEEIREAWKACTEQSSLNGETEHYEAAAAVSAASFPVDR